jgi:hypothetical protein
MALLPMFLNVWGGRGSHWTPGTAGAGRVRALSVS